VEDLSRKVSAAQGLYDSMRSERNTAMKNLAAVQEEMNELKRKTNVSGNHLEQLREELHSANKALLTEQFQVASFSKRLNAKGVEIETLKGLLESSVENANKQRSEMERYVKALHSAEADLLDQKRAYDSLLGERDALAAQLVHRNDELAVMHERAVSTAATIERGEALYAQRQEEVTALKRRVSCAAQSAGRDLCALNSLSPPPLLPAGGRADEGHQH
jgi:chromosome segregation ATPase